MKKLMTILGIMTLTVTPVITLVSCAKDKHLDKDGNSIILDYGRPVGDDNKVTGLNSRAILDAIKGKPEFKSKLVKDVLSIVNSSFLNNLDVFFSSENPEEGNSDSKSAISKSNGFEFYDDSTESTLSTAWKNVKESVIAQIDDERKLTDDKKKWKKKLEAKFPNFADESVEFLENKYRTSLLVEGEDNVESRIQQALIDNNHSGVTFVNPSELDKTWNDHKISWEKDKEKYKETIKNPNNETMRKQFAQFYNAAFTDVKSMKSVNDIENNFPGMFEDVVKNWVDKGENRTANPVPDEIDNLSQKGNGVKGILSNTQNYFLNNYFETKAPVVISEVTFAYSSNANFEQGIKEDSINDYNGSSAATQLNKFMKEIANETALTDKDWISNVTAENFNTLYGGTLTKADKIITIDDEQDSYLKSTVYDYLLNGGENSTNENGGNSEAFADTKSLLKEIDRTDDNKKLYKIINENLLVFLDASGVHFVYLHGSIKSNIKNGENDGYDRLSTFENYNNDKKAKISQNLYDQQADLNKFNELDDQGKLAAVYEYKKEDTLGSVNNSIKNEYAKYLINNSLTSDISGSFSTHNIVNNMKEWAKSSSKSSIDSKLTLFDYFKGLTKITDDGEFLEKFINFDPASNGKSDDAIKLKDMVVTMIGTLRAGSKVTSAMAMEKQFNELGKKIDSIKSDEVNGAVPPKGKFKETSFKADDIRNKIKSGFHLFVKSGSEYYDLISNYAIKEGK